MVADWTASEDWEIVYLGESGKLIRLPGVARVDVEAPTGIDIQKARGSKKAKVIDPGLPPVKLMVELEVQPDEMDELQSVLNVMRPRARTAAQKYLTIRHPLAALYDVSQVVIGDIGSPAVAPGGSFFLQFTCIEHAPEPKKVKKPKPADESADWAVQPLIDAANERPSSDEAIQRNFTAPEDIQNFTVLDGVPWSVP